MRDPDIKKHRSKPLENGFQTFSLDGRVLRGVRAAGFESPRPIQAKTIPAVLSGRDVLGLAQTGTGKTAAFALPILSNLLEGQRGERAPRALILAPTRELATQIDAEIGALGGFAPIRTALVFGGVSMNKQVQALSRRPDIVVACPGRLLDLHQRGAVDLRGVQTLVLDEADHMFDMGFLPAIRKILTALPERRQNLLFSATMPAEIRRLADAVLKRPHVVELEHSTPASTIEHALYPVEEARKQDLLERLLGERGFSSAIVFLRTKFRARRLAERLVRRGHRAVALQGNMSQGQRDRAMQGFRDGRFDVLVATDIAARGLDVEAVSHVINYDVPNTPDAYTHRIGRTGRAERRGKACTFVTDEDRGRVRDIEKKLGDRIPRVRVDEFNVNFRRQREEQRRSGASLPKRGRGKGGTGRGTSSSSSGDGGSRRGSSSGSGRSRRGASGAPRSNGLAAGRSGSKSSGGRRRSRSNDLVRNERGGR